MPINDIMGGRMTALTAALGGSPLKQSTASNQSFAQPLGQSSTSGGTFAQPLAQSGVSQQTFAQPLGQSQPSQGTFGSPNLSQPAIGTPNPIGAGTGFAAPNQGGYASGQVQGSAPHVAWQPIGTAPGQGREQGIYYKPNGQAAMTLEGFGKMYGPEAASRIGSYMGAKNSGNWDKWNSMYARDKAALTGDTAPAPDPAVDTYGGVNSDAGAPVGSILDFLGSLGGNSAPAQPDALVSALVDSTGQGMTRPDADYTQQRRSRYSGDSNLGWRGWR